MQFSNKFFISSLYSYCSQITGCCFCIRILLVDCWVSIHTYLISFCFVCIMCRTSVFVCLCIRAIIIAAFLVEIWTGDPPLQSKASSLKTLVLFVLFQVLRLPLINKTAKSNHILVCFDQTDALDYSYVHLETSRIVLAIHWQSSSQLGNRVLFTTLGIDHPPSHPVHFGGKSSRSWR